MPKVTDKEVLEGKIRDVNIHYASNYQGSFTVDLDEKCWKGQIKWFWVLNEPELAILARIAKYHDKKVRLRISSLDDFDQDFKAGKVVRMGIEGDRLYDTMELP